MLEDIRRLPESFYPHYTHPLPPLMRETAEHDEIQTGERASGLLHAATRHQTAELDRLGRFTNKPPALPRASKAACSARIRSARCEGV